MNFFRLVIKSDLVQKCGYTDEEAEAVLDAFIENELKQNKIKKEIEKDKR